MNEDQEDPVLLDIDAQGIAVLRINRPRARNALNWAAQDQFASCVAAVKTNQRVRVLIVTGTGDRTFVSGGDLKEHYQDHKPSAGARLNSVMGGALAGLGRLPIPVIAAVNGDALGGGCEIAAACDLRIASENARFGYVHVRVALTTGWGGSARLISLIGLSRASELLLSGRVFDAQEAFQIGFVHRLLAQEVDLLAAARSWAVELIALPADSLAAIKQLLNAPSGLAPDDSRTLETTLFLERWASPDHVEALNAFNEKRPPEFNQSE